MLYAGCSYKTLGKWHSEMEGKTWTWFDWIRADWGQTSVTTLDACEPRYASVCLHVRVRVWDFHITLPSRLLVWPGKLSLKVSLVFQCLSALGGAGVVDACWENLPWESPSVVKHEISGANVSDFSHWLQQKHIRYPTTKEMRSASGKQHQKRQGVSLLIFKMPTTLLHLSDLRAFTQGSMLLRSSNDSPQLIRGNKSLISVVAPLTGPPQERGGQAKSAIKRRLLTHIKPRQVYFFSFVDFETVAVFCAEQNINTLMTKWKHRILIFILRKGSEVVDLSVCTNPKCDQNPEYSCERKHSWSRLLKTAAGILVGNMHCLLRKLWIKVMHHSFISAIFPSMGAKRKV